MYGILVRNPEGQLLISSEVEGLHCLGRAQHIFTDSGLFGFRDFDGDGVHKHLRGRHIHRYVAVTDGLPVFFIHPMIEHETHGILRQWRSEGRWFVEVIQSGRVSAPPVVYTFTQPQYMPAPYEKWGMAALNAQGRKTFDTRLRPLAIYDALEVIPPWTPYNADEKRDLETKGHPWNDKRLDFDMNCDNRYNRYDISTRVTHHHLMFSAPSVAQAVYGRVKRGYKLSRSLVSKQEHWSTSVWWAMYHQAYRINTGSVIAGWAMYDAAFDFWSGWESAFAGGSGGSRRYGTQPYPSKTINFQKNMIILADARYYS